MSSTTLHATLSLTVAYDMVSEVDAVALVEAEGTAAFADLFEQEGQIVITDGTNSAVVLGDTILNLVQEGCFVALLALVESGEARIEMFATDEVVTLKQTGDIIELTGIFQPLTVLPAGAFVRAMFEVGERFLSMAARIWPEQREALDELCEYVNRIRPLLVAARSAACAADRCGDADCTINAAALRSTMMEI
jgi:hypothetical protein